MRSENDADRQPARAGTEDGQAGPGRIHLLDDALIDQIAAGEVVERPASVVKELVENALDAGARRIRVEVREGGSALIAVTDDGVGMTPGDARMALQRHATSKLSEVADLSRIASFGFRGEALPAIASVSRLRLVSRARGADHGIEVVVDGGQVVLERTAGGPEGTRIEVADLFGSVPARRKFLKRATTEWGHIADWLGRLALALPGVHFEIARDDREASVWPATEGPLDRVAAILSEREARALIPVVWEEAAGHLEAFVSTPDHSRANANGLYLYVNGRPVRDKLLRHAVLESYRDLLPRGRYPTAIVFVTVAPDQVDVNVHPAKWEVRFVASQAVHQLIRHGIREAMQGRSWLGGAPARQPAGRDRAAISTSADAVSHAERVGDAAAGRRGGVSSPGAAAEAASHVLFPSRLRPDARADRVAEQPSYDEPARLALSQLRLLGQVNASYLVLEGPDGVLLVDQHAAHERVLYERLRASWLERGVERQGLLVPVDVELAPTAIAAVYEAGDIVSALGFEIEPFGESAVLVRAVPALLAERDPAGLVEGLAQELEEGLQAGDVKPGEGADRTRLLRAADRVFATLACHGARRFGDRLVDAEQHAILAGLDSIPWAPTCPHGRPIVASLSVAEIEHRFGRR